MLLNKLLTFVGMIIFDLNRYFDIPKQKKIRKQAFNTKNYHFLD